MLLRPKWVDKSSLILFTKQFWFLFFNTAIYWISRKCLLFTWFFASDATVLSFLQENRHPLLAVCEAEPIGRGAAAVSPLLHPLSQLQSARCKSCSVLHIFYSYPPIASEVRFQDFPKPSTDFKHFEATANPLLASQKFVSFFGHDSPLLLQRSRAFAWYHEYSSCCQSARYLLSLRSKANSNRTHKSCICSRSSRRNYDVCVLELQ